MNFSKTTEYALRILSFMTRDTSRLYKASELSEALEIPYRYLRKLLTTLSKGELLTSVQGKTGGFKIARNLNDIYLSDIVKATGDSQLDSNCFFGYESCSADNRCAMHEKWSTVTDSISHILKTTSLADIKETERNNDF